MQIDTLSLKWQSSNPHARPADLESFQQKSGVYGQKVGIT